jgi:two-component system chemotaxis sensor kinase CheA
MSKETEDIGEVYLQDDMDFGMEQYKSVFIQETKEHLEDMTEALIILENNPEDMESLDRIFRSAHTVKGSSAMMGFEDLSKLTHAMEDAFDQLRKGARMPEGLMDVIFESMDLLESGINNLEHGVDEVLDFERHIGILRGIDFEKSGDSPDLEQRVGTGKGNNGLYGLFDEIDADKIIEEVSKLGEGETCLALNVSLDSKCLFTSVRAFMAVNRLEKLGRIIGSVPKAESFEDGSFDSHEFLVLLTTEKSELEVEECILAVPEIDGVDITPIDEEYLSQYEASQSKGEAKAETKVRLQTIKSIRVQTDQLDKLMNLVGELLINKVQLIQISEQYSLSSLKHSLDNVDRFTTELQDVVMRIRMVPVSQIFNRFPRLVRDLSHKQRKKVNFVLEGKEIELDRTILEEIGEPIIHLLRNSVDHGMELPEDRVASGKSEEGTIKLVAERRQNDVLIWVEDDGVGLNAEKIKAKALEKGLVTEAETKRMTHDQLVNLIMLPGFSTADVVTDVSGRGVGMDIVNTKIEALGGSVQLESQEGMGTKVTLKLPLTLSIIKAMLVEAADNVYAIPVGFVNELVFVDRGDVKDLGEINAVSIRGKVVPIVRIHDLLHLPHNEVESYTIIVVNKEPFKFGLIVDSMVGMQEIVTKNLDEHLNDIQGVVGATILGDGSVVLILNPINLYLSQNKAAGDLR